MKAKRLPSRQRRPHSPRRSLRESLHDFLTPALWKQAQQQRGQRKRSSRWTTQPLILTLLFMTWCCGDSQAERFETAKAYCQVCLRKRRGPGRTVQGFQKALARLPMVVLRTLAAGLRQMLPEQLGERWQVHGFVPLGCDGSRVECPRTTELEQHLGRAGKDGAAPTIWVTALVHLRLGVPWAWRFGKGTASERSHLEQLIGLLPRLALLVADAGYFGHGLMQRLLGAKVEFLVRMCSNVTLYTQRHVPLKRYREGVVYYWPSLKEAKKGAVPLRLRLIRLRERRRKHDVWLLTNVMDRRRLSCKVAGRMYRWRWENEGCFRTYKHTLKKVKLVSRTVRLVHREAEGSWLALQLLFAQGALAQRPKVDKKPAAVEDEVVCSPRKILIVIRREIAGLRRRGAPGYCEELQQAYRERRPRTSQKATREFPRRKPHKPPGPPKLRVLTRAKKALVAIVYTEAA